MAFKLVGTRRSYAGWDLELFEGFEVMYSEQMKRLQCFSFAQALKLLYFM
jgi:hypothetical protein